MSEHFSQTIRHLLGAYQARREEEAEERRRAAEAAELLAKTRREAVRRAVVPVVNQAADLLREAGQKVHVDSTAEDGSVSFVLRPTGGRRRADGVVPYTLYVEPRDDTVRVSAVYGERMESNPFLDRHFPVDELTAEQIEALLASFLEIALDH